MIKKILILTVFIVLLFNVNGQLFWKISGNGLTKPSYLFGTHHLIEKEQIKNVDKALTICKESDAVVGEIMMADKTQMQTQMMRGAMMHDTTCKELMNDADYALVDNEFKQLIGVGLDQLGTLKPMMLYTMHSVMTYYKLNDITKQVVSIDEIFQKTAIEKGREVLSLETMEQQIEFIFNSIALKRQAEILVQGIKDKDKNVALIKKMNQIYLLGDLDGAERLNKEDNAMSQDEKEIIIDNRNNTWMKQIPELINQKSCFIAVGFLHLAGETGLVNQLKNAGYKVEAVAL